MTGGLRFLFLEMALIVYSLTGLANDKTATLTCAHIYQDYVGADGNCYSRKDGSMSEQAISSDSPAAKKSAAGNANAKSDVNSDPCDEAYQSALADCKQGGTATQMAAMAQMGAGGIAAGTGGAYAACKAMEAQAITAVGSAGGVYMACTAAIKSCNAQCSPEQQHNSSPTDKEASRYSGHLRQCNAFSSQVKMQAIMAAGQGLMGLLSSRQCDSIVKAQEAGMCLPGSAPTFACNPMLFCQANQTHPECAGLVSACANPTTAQGNPLCGNLQNLAGTGINTALPTSDLLKTAESQNSTYAGYDSKAHGGAGGGDGPAGGGGGGLGGGGPSGGAGAPAAGGGGRDSGLKTDIGGGYGGGGASGGVALGNPTANGGGGGSYGRPDKLDLSRFLPNGDLANRGLASVSEKGITGANDLSNFEKVTRMMNQKRKFMIQ